MAGVKKCASVRIVSGASQTCFPHPLARIIVVEQLYRADSVRQGHPYHRS